jgi:hypothetical protein
LITLLRENVIPRGVTKAAPRCAFQFLSDAGPGARNCATLARSRNWWSRAVGTGGLYASDHVSAGAGPKGLDRCDVGKALTDSNRRPASYQWK